jgi:hypothetical protein
MLRLPSQLFLASVAFLASCAQPPAPLPPSSSNPTRLSAAVAAGRAPELATGNHRAFWIWRDDDGLWHLRTTSRRVSHRFQGTIRPLPGTEIVEFNRIGLDPNDRAGLVGRSISFDWRTSRLIDGFDFRLRGGTGLEFDLRLDEDGSSRYIYLGRERTKPATAHFLLGP